MGYKFEKYSIGGSVSGGYCNIECYYRYGSDPSNYTTLKEMLQSEVANLSITFEVVDALPQSPNESDFATFSIFNVYIYNDVPYAYGNAGAGNMWLGLADLLAAQGVTGVTAKGFTLNIKSETEEGIYVTYDEISENGCDKLRNEVAQTYAEYESNYRLLDNFITGLTPSIDLADWKNYGVGGFAYFRNLTTVTLPKIANTLLFNAFRGCSSLTTINGMESLVSIYANAFCDCTALENISLGVGFTGFDENIFNGSSLKRIDYNGTKAQWKAIKNSTSWDAGTGNYTIYCTDGTIAKDGTET